MSIEEEIKRINDELSLLSKLIEENKGEIKYVREELVELKAKVSKLEGKIIMLLNQNNTISLIIKYIVTPLLIILGALIGVKLTL